MSDTSHPSQAARPAASVRSRYDVIVIGGGHAGIEASLAAARMGCATALITMDAAAIGRMSCNPAIGGTAKGHLVREIDALGGEMAKIADASAIQFKMLNRSKGPAVWSPRSQNDRELYAEIAGRTVSGQEGLDIIAASVADLRVAGGAIEGIRTADGMEYACAALVICAGTFLNAAMYTGLARTIGGRFGEKPSTGITETLRRLGDSTEIRSVRSLGGGCINHAMRLETGRKMHSITHLRIAHFWLAEIARKENDAERAAFHYKEDLRLEIEFGDLMGYIDNLAGLAWVSGAKSRWREAVMLYAVAERILDQCTPAGDQDESRAMIQQELSHALDHLGETSFREARSEGQSLTVEQAIALIPE